jgi:MFS transporter, FSR family, fosmidomycin resistance protein
MEKKIYVLQALAKGFSIFYFVLLPVFYAEGWIDSTQLGYVGALFIVAIIAGALLVSHWLYTLNTKKLLVLSSSVAIGACLLFLAASWFHSVILLLISYCSMGLATGTAMSGVNAVIAYVTTRGDRFKAIAQLAMLTDVIRIVFPLVVAGAILVGAPNAAILLIIVAAIIFLVFSMLLPAFDAYEHIVPQKIFHLLRNRPFRYVISLEFLDSFASSQLFVFLPLIFLARGYTLESSILFQTAVFLGYMIGRWLVSVLATRYSGLRAIGYAEIGMVVCISLLLMLSQIWILYALSFLLGVFARGTSPAIKALAFDSLERNQVKQGSAVHVIAGDSGSALGQFIFGLLVAWYGVNMPFIVAAVVAGIIALFCFLKPRNS